jgi:hypothetical protein
MLHSLEHQGEKRQMGVLAFITRPASEACPEDLAPTMPNLARREALLIVDELKQEAAAGLLNWSALNAETTPYRSRRTLGLVGGGRAPHISGQEETVWQTLAREFEEEAGFALTESMLKQAAEQQPHPFGVVQQKACRNEQEGLPPLNLFAVTAAWLNYEQLPEAAQEHLAGLVAADLACWVPVAELAMLYELSNHHWGELADEGRPGKLTAVEVLPFRPQVLLTAWLWWLHHAVETQPDQLTDQVQTLNRGLYRFAQTNLQPNQALSNGTFNPDGAIFKPEQLPASDRDFLYPEPVAVIVESKPVPLVEAPEPKLNVLPFDELTPVLGQPLPFDELEPQPSQPKLPEIDPTSQPVSKPQPHFQYQVKMAWSADRNYSAQWQPALV